MNFRIATCGLVLAAAVSIAAGGSLAADGQSPADIIKARQEHLKDMGGAMKSIGDQLKAGAIDKASATEAAKKVAAYAKELPTWFPKGTGPEAGVKTAAKPEIWTQPDEFKAAAAKLPPAADKLVEVVATGDAAAIGGQLMETGKVCGGCHKPFRVPPPEH